MSRDIDDVEVGLEDEDGDEYLETHEAPVVDHSKLLSAAHEKSSQNQAGADDVYDQERKKVIPLRVFTYVCLSLLCILYVFFSLFYIAP